MPEEDRQAPTYITEDRAKEYTTAIEYDVSNNPIYIGKAPIGTAKATAGWQIQKLTWASSNCTDVQFAGGSRKFDKVWNSRASYSYS